MSVWRWELAEFLPKMDELLAIYEIETIPVPFELSGYWD